MAISLDDAYQLAQDSGFEHKVMEALLVNALTVWREVPGTDARRALCSKVLGNPLPMAQLMAKTVATQMTSSSLADLKDIDVINAIYQDWDAFASVS